MTVGQEHKQCRKQLATFVQSKAFGQGEGNNTTASSYFQEFIIPVITY